MEEGGRGGRSAIVSWEGVRMSKDGENEVGSGSTVCSNDSILARRSSSNPPTAANTDSSASSTNLINRPVRL